MGKRKRKEREIKRKIRRLQERLDESSSTSSEEEYRRRYYEDTRALSSTSDEPAVNLSDTDSTGNTQNVRPAVQKVPALSRPSTNDPLPGSSNDRTVAAPSTSAMSAIPCGAEAPSLSDIAVTPDVTVASLPADILEALGDPKGKDEVFGSNIPEEISQRWGRILVDGLTKEQRLEIREKTLVPNNFRLVKAPILNPEISAILSDSVRSRDKVLEKDQNTLGLGIAGLTHLTASLIEGDFNKIDVIKKVSEISQIFLDLHFENTKTRRKLLMASLDKKFTTVVVGVKRDSMLFGENLGEKIKAIKTAEKSGMQVKKSDFKKYTIDQGNWKGPPKQHGQRGLRQGGHKRSQSFRRPAATTDRFQQSSSKARPGSQKQ